MQKGSNDLKIETELKKEFQWHRSMVLNYKYSDIAVSKILNKYEKKEDLFKVKLQKIVDAKPNDKILCDHKLKPCIEDNIKE